MNIWKKLLFAFLSLYFFWVLLFDFQRILFSFHHYDRVFSDGLIEWFKIFIYSIRLDLTMASFLSFIPIIFLYCYFVFQKKVFANIFKGITLFFLLIVVLIHAGEVNAYNEWNSKLTARVFVNIIHPDEVFRTADFGMVFRFIIYSIIEFLFGLKVLNWLFKIDKEVIHLQLFQKILILIPILPFVLGLQFLLARGGWQQIPINIDVAYYSENYVLNDLSVNSAYFFTKNFMLYQRGDIGQYISKYDTTEIHQILGDFYNYDKNSSIEILKNKRPNLVFVVMESWTANVVGKIIGEENGSTPEFDKLADEGVLFTNIYSASTTSEVGNSTILAGYPALPEIFITMQPAKHRHLKTINQTLKQYDYTAGFYFGGDLKYGNIQSFITDHGFERVHDENDFPKDIKRGKLNYYDEDLFRVFLDEINAQKQPFMECAFTGSTHSPYDCPTSKKGNKWTGKDANFMNAVLYSDESIADFIANAKKEPWYDNTLFVFVADHGHTSPVTENPSNNEFYHIPLLFYGNVLKEEVKGIVIDKIGSQADIVQTILQQMNIQTEDYPWSKNLLSKDVPQFAFHAMSRGFGWVTPAGQFTYNFDLKQYPHNTFNNDKTLQTERKRCDAFMQLLYEQYSKLGVSKDF